MKNRLLIISVVSNLVRLVGLKANVENYYILCSYNCELVDANLMGIMASLSCVLKYMNFCPNIVSLFVMNTDEQHLKALELNSWQLFRLLQAQLPGLSCENSPCESFIDDQGPRKSKCNGNLENMICCLYLNATVLHSSWKSKNVSRWVHMVYFILTIKTKFIANMADAQCCFIYYDCRSYSRADYSSIVAAYYEFLKTGSEWLSRRVTDVCLFLSKSF